MYVFDPYGEEYVNIFSQVFYPDMIYIVGIMNELLNKDTLSI